MWSFTCSNINKNDLMCECLCPRQPDWLEILTRCWKANSIHPRGNTPEPNPKCAQPKTTELTGQLTQSQVLPNNKCNIITWEKHLGLINSTWLSEFPWWYYMHLKKFHLQIRLFKVLLNISACIFHNLKIFFASISYNLHSPDVSSEHVRLGLLRYILDSKNGTPSLLGI